MNHLTAKRIMKRAYDDRTRVIKSLVRANLFDIYRKSTYYKALRIIQKRYALGISDGPDCHLIFIQRKTY